MEFILIRHGNTAYNDRFLIQGRIDIPLSKSGINEAKKKAKAFLKKEGTISKAYSSPLTRAQQTAKIFLNKKLSYTVFEDLTERTFGEIEGTNVFNYPYSNAFFDEPKYGIEVNRDLETRVFNAIKTIALNSKDSDKIAIFSHSHTIKAICKVIDPNKYDYTSPLLNFAGVRIIYKNKKFKIIETNIIY